MAQDAFLVLEDGTVFKGEAFGARTRSAGEVVFNTSMTGYQEVLTDPSYLGQIVVMTYPLIGNYGINDEDSESLRPMVAGFVVYEACSSPSSWRSRYTLEGYLEANGVPGIQGIDTRALVRHIRSKGTMMGAVSTDGTQVEALKELIISGKSAVSLPHFRGISIPRREVARAAMTPRPCRIEGPGWRIVVLDFGIKENIIRSLKRAGCDIVVLPGTAGIEEVMSWSPHGVVLSNGPGDPRDAAYAAETIRYVASVERVPTMGICLGHQLVAIAFGGETFKLKFGHRGANHPVYDYERRRVLITSQNHGYAVDEERLPCDLIVTHRNINDGTIEGLRHISLPVFSVQFHPEAAPGPLDAHGLFAGYLEMVGRRWSNSLTRPA
ncbi:MAG TPA: glutamine-hydrolyzing carbamoyl-phosphate synthase small subunit [Firmicutes bacterium]|nr:glutamine-hydrolyzing carbamoyl-phosphate synthase small subunit [Bacillota bacterium]